MNAKTYKNVLGALITVLMALMATVVFAADWPTKPVKLIIPFAPGGGADQTLMPLKPPLEKEIGQNILFTYKEGAGGQIGWEMLHGPEPDGSTIGYLALPHLINTVMYQNPKYKLESFASLGLITGDVPLWFVKKGSPYKNMNDLIEAAKQRPGQIKVALGCLTGEHFLTVLVVEKQAGVKFRWVPVGGGGKVNAGILGGHFDVGVTNPSASATIFSEVHALGVVDSQRCLLLPDTKTFDEQLPSNIRVPHLSRSRGFIARRELKEKYPDRFGKLATAVKNAVHTPEYMKALKSIDLDLSYKDPNQSWDLIKTMEITMRQYDSIVTEAKKEHKEK